MCVWFAAQPVCVCVCEILHYYSDDELFFRCTIFNVVNRVNVNNPGTYGVFLTLRILNY